MAQIAFDPDKHRYTIDGTEVPSVTQICRFLSYDQKSTRPWLAEAAARRGTAIHEAALLIDYGAAPEEPPEIAGYLLAYRRFLSDYRPQWQGVERILGSKCAGYAGTCDRYGLLAGERAIVEIKTGAALHQPALQAQLNGYRNLLPALGFAAQRLYGLRLDKSGVYQLEEVPADSALFNACMTLHRATAGKKGRNHA